jgi:uncharacterized RDD family membrane protein YckC
MTCTSCGANLRDDARICLNCGEIMRVASSEPAVAVDARSLGIPVWLGPGQSRDSGSSIRSGRFPRLMAAFIDLVIINVISAPVFLLFFGDRVEAAARSGSFEPDWTLWAVNIGLIALYLVIFPLTPLRGTPGKRLLGMRVVDSEGQPLDFGLAFMRSFWQIFFLTIAFPLAAIFALFGVVAVIIAFVFLIGDGGSPWDSIAGTRVVD